jgi:hypothetical protein
MSFWEAAIGYVICAIMALLITAKLTRPGLEGVFKCMFCVPGGVT